MGCQVERLRLRLSFPAVKRRLLDLLACPLCNGDLDLVDGDATGSEVVSGTLTCHSTHEWTIRDGIPRLVPPDLAPIQERTAEAFGFEWTHFDEMHPQYEAQFLDWLQPIGPAFFRDKVVLDAGCGTGRHARLAAAYGARDVVALDLSDAVETARLVLEEHENALVVQGDLLRPPLKGSTRGGGFDLVYSIGVLHHLPIPREGFLAVARLVRPGGTLAVWVYGYENNGFVRNVVEPLRQATTRVPPPVLRPLALPFAAAFHGAARGIYRPLEGTRLGRALPLNEYMSSVADFSFRQNHSIVFDQLVAPTAAYIRGPELREWFDAAGFDDVALSHRHRNSWRGKGIAPASPSR
jgi:SAM-dependent methyltransferase